MNNHFHTPSFGDDVFNMDDSSTSNSTTSLVVNSTFSYQQQTPTSTQTTNALNTASSGNITPTSSTAGPTTMAARKQMLPLDQNEPAKPLSAYALFFRDTVSAIKQQKPTCSFQELSKIVASMWDALDPVHKSVYNKKNELAKTEYIKQMRLYQQQQQQQQQQQLNSTAIDSSTSIQQQQQTVTTTSDTAGNQQPPQPQQNIQITNSNNNNSQVTSNAGSDGTLSGAQNNLTAEAEAGTVQKCTRENCNKRAIINPDWEDEYCSNECVIIHCRNVFNAWVQSNIMEAKQQQQQQQQSSAT